MAPATCFDLFVTGRDVVITSWWAGALCHIPAKVTSASATGVSVVLKLGANGIAVSFPHDSLPLLRVLQTTPFEALTTAPQALSPARHLQLPSPTSPSSQSDDTPHAQPAAGADFVGKQLIFGNKIKVGDTMGVTLVAGGKMCNATLSLSDVNPADQTFELQTTQGEIWKWPSELFITEVRRFSSSSANVEPAYPHATPQDVARDTYQHGYMSLPTMRDVFDFLQATTTLLPRRRDPQAARPSFNQLPSLPAVSWQHVRLHPHRSRREPEPNAEHPVA
jgi:hypothetical protein